MLNNTAVSISKTINNNNILTGPLYIPVAQSSAGANVTPPALQSMFVCNACCCPSCKVVLWDQVNTPKGINADGNGADNDAVAEAAQLFCNKPKRQAVKVRNPDIISPGRHLPTATAEPGTKYFVDK